MGFLRKLLSGKAKPATRVRVCVECGMPIAEHKAWCSILQTQTEMELAKRARQPETES